MAMGGASKISISYFEVFEGLMAAIRHTWAEITGGLFSEIASTGGHTRTKDAITMHR